MYVKLRAQTWCVLSLKYIDKPKEEQTAKVKTPRKLVPGKVKMPVSKVQYQQVYSNSGRSREQGVSIDRILIKYQYKRDT